jgi:hypothetical protein
VYEIIIGMIFHCTTCFGFAEKALPIKCSLTGVIILLEDGLIQLPLCDVIYLVLSQNPSHSAFDPRKILSYNEAEAGSTPLMPNDQDRKQLRSTRNSHPNEI